MPTPARSALIVEPSRTQRSVLAALLREAGADFAEAASLAAGLRRAAEQRFDLICVASKLRDGTGVQFCSALRTTPEMAAVPVLALLSEPDTDKVKALLDAGATEVIEPTQIERIRQFLAMVLPPLPVLHGRVLVVDDELAAAETLVATLRSLGLEASHVPDPKQAMTRVRGEPIDLLVIAAMLHGPVTGSALIREVRALPGAEGRTPILALASPTDTVRRIEVLRSGADDFVPKPVFAEELTMRVERLVRRKRREEENEAQRATFEALALTDPLTTLNNRRFLSEIGPMYLADAHRHHFPLSVVVVILDHFEEITRRHEPAICEDMLRSIGRLLRRESRRGDVAVRAKDDQFVLLLSHCAMPEARVKAEELRAQVANLHPCGVAVTVSAGVAQADTVRGEGFAEVFKRAAQAALAASQAGRDRVVIAADA
jgi:two-component system cell cycle response regulator